MEPLQIVLAVVAVVLLGAFVISKVRNKKKNVTK